MMVWSGNPVVCMAMAPPEQRESVTKYSRLNTRQENLNWVTSSQNMAIMSEASTEKILRGKQGSFQWECRMVRPVTTGGVIF